MCRVYVDYVCFDVSVSLSIVFVFPSLWQTLALKITRRPWSILSHSRVRYENMFSSHCIRTSTFNSGQIPKYRVVLWHPTECCECTAHGRVSSHLCVFANTFQFPLR